MVAYVQWKGSLCRECGLTADLALDPTVTFSVTDSICWGCRVREDKEAELRKAAEKHPGQLNGVKVYISNARRNPPAPVE